MEAFTAFMKLFEVLHRNVKIKIFNKFISFDLGLGQEGLNTVTYLSPSSCKDFLQENLVYFRDVFRTLSNIYYGTFLRKCDTLRDLVPFVQFKKRAKQPWRSVTFSLKVTLLHGCFSLF